MKSGVHVARATLRPLVAVALAVSGLAWLGEAPVGAADSSGGAAAATVTRPDMRMLVLRGDISIGIDGISGDRMLHYSHVTSDLGPGPFEIVPHYNAATGVATFSQVIFNRPSPGHWRPDHRVPLGAVGVFHQPSDYQFPLNSFALLNAAGRVVARSPKTDYCITGDYRVGGVPHTPDQTSPPPGNCGDPHNPLGWSVGWGDQYDQTDSGQPIDIQNLPDGTYTLRGTVDPEHLFTETDKTNNVTDTKLTITSDQVQVGAQTHPNLPLPSVRITAPRKGARVHDTVRLTASASAKGSRVRSVQFLVDGVPVGKPDTTAPYAVRWHAGSVSAGRHYVSARVRNSKQIMNTARPVAVTVQARLGGLVVDRSATVTGRGVATQRGVSAPSGDLLVALIGADGQGQRVKVHGGGLTWKLVRRANGQPGDAEVWSARAHSALHSLTVRATAAHAGLDVWMNVVALRGAAGIGRSRASSSSGAAPKVSFTASAAGSIGMAAGNDFDQAAARQVGSGQRLLGQKLAASGDTFWSQATSTGAKARGRTITLDDPSPTGDRTNLVGVEVRTSAKARADGAAPTVRIANPIRRQTVSGTVPVAAFAGDDVAVSSVRFSVDGHRIGAPVTSAPYVRHWDTTTTTSGRHVLTARAVDVAGRVTTTHQVVRVMNPAPPMTCFVVQSDVSARGTGAVSTPRFHTATDDEVLLALVSSDGPAAAGAQSAVVHGAGLTWHLVGRANTQRGDAEVWTAKTDRVLTRARVTSTPAVAGYDQHLTVVALEGVTHVGAMTSAEGSTGAPQAALAITGPSASLVFAVGTARGAVRPTLPTGQIFAGHWADRAAHVAFWSQYTNQAMSPAGTTVTMRTVRPTSRPWNFVAVEAVGEEE